MIDVITLISVQERTKEIGILRAIGGSKSDVSSMFNAKTVIIGFASGLLWVTVTYFLCIPINMILHQVTGIEGLNLFLPTNKKHQLWLRQRTAKKTKEFSCYWIPLSYHCIKFKNCWVLSFCGFVKISLGLPFSTMTPWSIKIISLATSLAKFIS